MIHMVTIKLSSSNYLLWKSQLLPLLESQELLGHVDGTLAPPPWFALADSQTPNIKYLAWKNTDQRLLSLLLPSLTKEAMAEVVGLSTSREVWLALENTFSHRSKAKEIWLKDDLQLMRRGMRSITEYARVFKALCDQLHAIGRPVDDTIKSTGSSVALVRISPAFPPPKWLKRHCPPFSIWSPRLKALSFFRNPLTIIKPVSPSIRLPLIFPLWHWSFQLRAGPPSATMPDLPPEGHYADKCNQRYARGGEFVGTTANLAEAFKASCSLNGPEPSDWYLDTGASAHMTLDLSHLDQASNYTGKDRVVVGNGASLPITHTARVMPLVLVLLIPLFCLSSSKSNIHTSQAEHFNTLGEGFQLGDRKYPPHSHVALRFCPHLYKTILESVHCRKRCQRACNFHSSLRKRFHCLFSNELIELVSGGITSN
ncbi:hypothetical protein AAG906_028176 [Vitis piasezkii]